MKTASKIYAGIATSLLLVVSACTNDLTDEPKVPTTGGDSKLKLELSLDGTRAYTDKTSFTEGDEILVRAQTRGENNRICADSCKAIYTNGKWNFVGGGIDLNNVGGVKSPTDVTINAFYPYSEVAPGYGSILMNVDDMMDQVDIIAGTVEGINSSNPTAKITMNHTKAMLNLKVANPTDESIVISDITMSCYSEGNDSYPWFCRKGRITTSTVSNFTSSANDEIPEPYTFSANTIINAKETAEIKILVPYSGIEHYEWENTEGHTENTGVNFNLIVDGKPYSFNVATPNWMYGYTYTYNVTLKEKPTPFIEDGKIDGYGYVDFGLNVVWATTNLGADQPLDRGLYYQWGGIEGMVESTSFAEDWWLQDATLEDMIERGVVSYMSQYDESLGKFYRLNPEYDAATHERGEKWRIPTNLDIQNLVDITDKSLEIINGIFCIKLTSKKDKSKYIYMPFFTATMSNTESEITADYWGSTIREDLRPIRIVVAFDYICHFGGNTTQLGNSAYLIRPVASSDLP